VAGANDDGVVLLWHRDILVPAGLGQRRARMVTVY
jgi:hypothetical protein